MWEGDEEQRDEFRRAGGWKTREKKWHCICRYSNTVNQGRVPKVVGGPGNLGKQQGSKGDREG